MEKLLILTFFIFLNSNLFAQENLPKEAKAIIAEGYALYKSEMASWYGTDLFLENYKERENIGGYFSYLEEDSAKCIFFSKAEKPQVIGVISFDSTYNIKNANLNLNVRTFTNIENSLYEIRKIALAEINSDTLFKIYKNTSLNLIPLINKQEKKVYILTGPQNNGVVIFGNDYLLTFDINNKVLSKKRLHNNIIPLHYGREEDKNVVETSHTHLPETGDFITATDICTLMLYGKFTGWKKHSIISKEYLNIWNCETNRVNVVPMKVIDKINNNKKKREKKKK